MKLVTAIIRPDRFFPTEKALAEARLYAMSTKEVLGRGKAPVHFSSGEGAGKGAADATADAAHATDAENHRYEDLLVAKRMIQVFATDEDASRVVDVILEVNSRGHHGDGKVFVTPVDGALRIHTGETNDDALS